MEDIPPEDEENKQNSSPNPEPEDKNAEPEQEKNDTENIEPDEEANLKVSNENENFPESEQAVNVPEKPQPRKIESKTQIQEENNVPENDENAPEDEENPSQQNEPVKETEEILNIQPEQENAENYKENSHEMNVNDDEEENCAPKPKIQTLHKAQPSFMQPSTTMPTKKEKLRTLFLRYADVSAETGIPTMKSRLFIKLMSDAKLIDTPAAKLTKSKVDLIYSSFVRAKRGFMTFEIFLQCLVRIGEMAYPELAVTKKSKAVEQLISQWLMPLLDMPPARSIEMGGSSRFKQSEDFENIEYNQDVKEIMTSVLPMLKDIYDVYFGNAFKSAKDYKQIAQISTKQLMVFLREFDLTKNFVQKPISLVMLDKLVHTPDEKLTNSKTVDAVFGDITQDYGCYFTLARFFIFLLWIAVTGFDSSRPDAELFTNAEKVFFLLAKMELSNGFLTLYKTVPKSLSIQHTLIPPAAVLTKVIQNNPLSPDSKKKSEDSQLEEDKSSSKIEHEKEQERIAIEMCTDKLQRLFMLYCAVNDNANTNKMPLFKFNMFLKDAGIIGPISMRDAELIFYKVVGSLNDKRFELDKEKRTSPLKNSKVAKMYIEDESKRAKLDFKAFYYAVTLIAKKLYPTLSTSKAMIELTEKNIKVLEEKNAKVEKNSELLRGMFEALREEKVVELLTWVHKLVKVYFDAYTDNTGVMGYETFVKFCKDFGIFPDLCSKIVLHSTFYALAFVNSRIIEGTNPSIF